MTGQSIQVSDIDTPQSVPINLLRQWHFCPRIPYYQELLGTQITRPPWVKQGHDYEIAQHHLFRRRNLSRFGLDNGTMHTQVYLDHPDEPFHGIADLVIETSEVVHVVEIKLRLDRVGAGIIAQLTALGILAEAHWNKPATDAFVVYGADAKVKHLNISDDLRRQARHTAQQIQTMLISAVKPASPAGEHQCAQCEYLNYCNDR